MPPRKPEGRISCLAPLIGIFVGFSVGWVFHFALPKSKEVDVACRLYTLVFGAVGWAGAVVVRGKQVHCGGTRNSDAQAKNRYIIGFWVILPCLVLAALFLACSWFFWYYLLLAVLAAIVVGEAGWGSPFFGLGKIRI